MANQVNKNMPGDNSSPALEDWEKEDPNLLNNPELLFQECAKLPPPATDERSRECEKEFWEAVKVTRELLLDQNFILDALSKREEFQGSRETARGVIENLINNFERDSAESTENLLNYKNMPSWNEAVKKKIFSSRSTERVTQWKLALNSFLDNYLKIRSFIPKDSLEDREGGELSEKEKEECKYLQIVVDELQGFLETLDVK